MYTTELENLIDQLQRYRITADRWYTECRRQHYTVSCWHLVEKLLPSLPAPYADSWRSKMRYSWKRPPPAFPSLTRGHDLDQLLQSPPAPLPTGPPSVCAVLSDHSDAVRVELGRRGFGCFSVRQRQRAHTTAATRAAALIKGNVAEVTAPCAGPTPATSDNLDNHPTSSDDDDGGTAMTQSAKAVSPARAATTASTAKTAVTNTTAAPDNLSAHTKSDGQLTHGVINLDVNGVAYTDPTFGVTTYTHTQK